MSEYDLEILGDLNLSDYSSIHDYMGLVNFNDKVTITLHPSNFNESNIICNMLVNSDFNVISEGGKNNDKYYITAQKKKKT